MAKIRGLSLIRYLEYLKKKGIADKVLASSDEKVRTTLQNLKPQEWYSYEETYCPLVRSIAKIVNNDAQFFIDMGKFDAQHNEKWYLKLFFMFTSPRGIIEKFPTLWNIYWDIGKIEISKLDEKSATVRIVGIDTILLSDLTVQGWGEYALEKAGAKNIKLIQTKCRERGDEYTEWRGSWD